MAGSYRTPRHLETISSTDYGQNEESPSVSVVIATYCRPEDLTRALNSVVLQTHIPQEVFVIDDSPDDRTEKAVGNMVDVFRTKGIRLVYIRNMRGRSLTTARNLGVDNSSGDILMFLDDDVILDKNYISEVLRVFKTQPHALGVQGFWGDQIKLSGLLRLYNLFGRFFFTGYFQKNRCDVLPSFISCYPYELTSVIECQWLSGCNQSYSATVFKEFRFDEKLARYSPGGEDVDFSMKVQKLHPHSLFITPWAKLLHNYARVSRTPRKNLVYLETVYKRYLFGKNIPQSMRNRAIFCWSQVGRIVTLSASWAGSQLRESRSPSDSVVTGLKYLIDAQVLCHKHRNEIMTGDFEFLKEYVNY